MSKDFSTDEDFWKMIIRTGSLWRVHTPPVLNWGRGCMRRLATEYRRRVLL